MSLGLPGHLAAEVVSASIARGARVVGGVALAVAVLVHLVVSMRDFGAATPLIPIMFGALALALTLLDRRGGVLFAVLYLAAGAGALVVVAVTTNSLPTEYATALHYLETMVWIAVLMVGGSGGRAINGIAFTLAGFAAGAGGMLVGALASGTSPSMDPAVPLAAVLVVLIYAMTGHAARTARIAQPKLNRAANEEKLAEVRSDVEARAAALLHDTVLGSLAAVSNSPVGDLGTRLRETIRADLHAIVEHDWSERAARSVTSGGGPIGREIDEADALGVRVDATGDMAHLDRIGDQAAESVALALRQLLVNVRLHSGTDAAEVVVFGNETTVSIMVIDGGRGFDPDAVAADRLGLRNSVSARLAQVGGSVKIWSAPGRGTSVLLNVPATGGGDGDSVGSLLMEDAR
jgi:signal transduction histidine kinase